MEQPSAPQALERHLIYRSSWVNLYLDKVLFPNGMIIEEHHLLDFDHHAVMTLACDDDGRFVMVKVCRYPTGRAEWEFPAGRIEAGEGIIQAGERELLEETGYRSTRHALLYTYNPLNGIANQVFHIVCCKVADRAGSFDANEITAVEWFSEADIWRMIRAQEIHDGYTLMSFLLNQHLQPGPYGGN